MSIKPIETVYDGYRFRSRLEARWAVCFNTMGVPYHYEWEGFDIDGTRYLPDFELYEMEHKPFVEIKGLDPTPEEIRKAARLSKESGRPVYIFSGEIGFKEVGVPTYRGRGFMQGFEVMSDAVWCECEDCHKVGMRSLKPSLGLCCLLPCECHEKRYSKDIRDLADYLHYGLSIDSPRLIASYTSGRQARFEHGEQPMSKPSPMSPKPALIAPPLKARREITPANNPIVQEVVKTFNAKIVDVRGGKMPVTDSPVVKKLIVRENTTVAAPPKPKPKPNRKRKYDILAVADSEADYKVAMDALDEVDAQEVLEDIGEVREEIEDCVCGEIIFQSSICDPPQICICCGLAMCAKCAYLNDRCQECLNLVPCTDCDEEVPRIDGDEGPVPAHACSLCGSPLCVKCYSLSSMCDTCFDLRKAVKS